MPVSRAMRRLLRIREIEEERSRAALEAALGERRQMETMLKAARASERHGRRLVTASASSGEMIDRVAGLEETRSARRLAERLEPMIAEAEWRAEAFRREFMAKRIDRRQVENLIKKAEAEDAIEAGRQAQRELDDLFLRSMRKNAQRQRDLS